MRWGSGRSGGTPGLFQACRPCVPGVPRFSVSPPPPSTPSAPTAADTAARWFTEEVQPHDAQLKAYLRSSFPAVRDIEDVVQESYLRIWRSRAAKPIYSAKAFLFKIARHVALNLLDRQRGSPVVFVGDLAVLPALEEKPGVVEAIGKAEKVRLLAEALATLPPRCREITVLRKLRAIPQREVATRLGIAEKTVEEQVARGVRRCEAYLRRRGITTYHGP